MLGIAKGVGSIMEVVLKQSGNRIGLYINNELATVITNKTADDVAGLLKRNLLNTKILISK